jgi:hypothetical protein
VSWPEAGAPASPTTFTALTSALALWNRGALGLRWAEAPDTAMAWEQVLHVGVIAIPVLFYRYVVIFLGDGGRHPGLLIGYALCGLFLAASPTPLFMRGVIETSWGWAPAEGPLYAPFVAYFQIYLVLGLFRLIRAYRSMASSYRRNRARLVILGAAISILGGAVDFVRFILGWEALYPVGIPAGTLFGFALGVAIIRYRLLDISVLARRAALYTLCAMVLASGTP